MTNLLAALCNLVQNPISDIVEHYHSATRANMAGDSLEHYIKDLFCNSFSINAEKKKNIYGKHFSYLGNQNNPPDFILENGDAIEVKKIEGLASSLALNSSYPKNKLYADSTMITNACRECEDSGWTEKDLISCLMPLIMMSRKTARELLLSDTINPLV